MCFLRERARSVRIRIILNIKKSISDSCDEEVKNFVIMGSIKKTFMMFNSP